MRYFLITIVALCFFVTTIHAQAPNALLKDKPIDEQIEYWADYYKTDTNTLKAVIKCESDYDINSIAYNDGGSGHNSIGLLQFQESTFLTWEKKIDEDLNWDSPFDQIKLGAYMFSKGQKHQWTCFRILHKNGKI